MTPTKLLIGQIIVVFAIVLAGVWFATQWAAAELAYQPELGSPWFVAFGRPIYRPWALFGWWFSLDRKSVVSGKSVSVRVDLGGRRILKKKKKRQIIDKIANTNVTTYTKKQLRYE